MRAYENSPSIVRALFFGTEVILNFILFIFFFFFFFIFHFSFFISHFLFFPLSLHPPHHHQETPYEGAVFLFDMSLSSDYPSSPPLVYYHSCGPRLHPNLYENGRVCLSLLGTWSGKGVEMWSNQSNMLQVILSIQGLILGKLFFKIIFVIIVYILLSFVCCIGFILVIFHILSFHKYISPFPFLSLTTLPSSPF